MIDLKKVELKDKTWMEPLIAAADMRACHQNFTNIFAWGVVYQYRVAQVDNYLAVKGFVEEGGHYYFYPAGSGDLKPVLQALKKDAEECGHPFQMFGVSPENREVLNSMYPDDFEYQEMRDSYDYVYLLEKLVTLKGNKLHSKRNHINRFKQNSNWSFELISADNLDECWKMNLKWCKDNDCDDDEQLMKEKCAVRRCFDHYFQLGLEGGLLRLDGRVIAFTMGEVLNSDTYVTHVEKAFSEIQGAYQMINREFAALIQENHPGIVYVNREEDMGFAGLRKAKQSYHPYMMEEKYLARYIG